MSLVLETSEFSTNLELNWKLYVKIKVSWFFIFPESLELVAEHLCPTRLGKSTILEKSKLQRIKNICDKVDIGIATYQSKLIHLLSFEVTQTHYCESLVIGANSLPKTLELQLFKFFSGFNLILLLLII